jgi:diguanylate cyclase (GGDEF)-like protein/PAS domain S-box-containing protein
MEPTTPAPDADFYKTLLESTKAIPWRIDWPTQTFSYVGPQIEALLGWAPASWATVGDWVARMHPEDQAWVPDFCVSQSLDGIDHEADYRALTASGDYVWIRDVVHVIRTDGAVQALVGFMFDISARKQTEMELIRLKKELEALSLTDSLVGVPNRRRFDAVLAEEWENARRHQQPLSVILLDIDYFKQYNDHYGHLQGDACLRRIGQVLNKAATRTRDFFGRYGGEEFVLVLPETDRAAAQVVAERCRGLIFKQQIPHARSGVCPVITASFGVGTLIPDKTSDAQTFMETVDRLLYQAKHSGRNRVVSSR